MKSKKRPQKEKKLETVTDEDTYLEMPRELTELSKEAKYNEEGEKSYTHLEKTMAYIKNQVISNANYNYMPPVFSGTKEETNSTNKKIKKEYPNLSIKEDIIYFETSENFIFSLNINNGCSRNIGIFHDITDLYYIYGLRYFKKEMEFLIENFNKIQKIPATFINFGLFAIQDNNTELLKYFYSIANCASDIKKNNYTNKNEVVFMVEFKC